MSECTLFFAVFTGCSRCCRCACSRCCRCSCLITSEDRQYIISHQCIALLTCGCRCTHGRSLNVRNYEKLLRTLRLLSVVVVVVVAVVSVVVVAVVTVVAVVVVTVVTVVAVVLVA